MCLGVQTKPLHLTFTPINETKSHLPIFHAGSRLLILQKALLASHSENGNSEGKQYLKLHRDYHKDCIYALIEVSIHSPKPLTCNVFLWLWELSQLFLLLFLSIHGKHKTQASSVMVSGLSQ